MLRCGKRKNDEGERLVTALESPPAVPPETTVRMAIVSNSKRNETMENPRTVGRFIAILLVASLAAVIAAIIFNSCSN